MFFRWPWDGAATLLGPSGRPLATSPAVQGASPGKTGAEARRPQQKGERVAGARNAPATSTTPASPGTRATPPAGSSTQAPATTPRSFAPKRTPLAAARWERARGAAGHRFRHTTLGSGSTGSGSESTRRCRTKPATSSAAAVPQHQAARSSARRPHHHGNGGPTAATAVSRSDTQRPGEPRTADQTGNKNNGLLETL